jgi:hypothetical protein
MRWIDHGRGAIVVALLGACQLDTSGTGAPSNMIGTVDGSGSGETPEGTSGDDSASTSAATLGDASVDGSDEGSSSVADPSGDPGSSSSSADGTAEGTTGVVDECATPAFFSVQIAADQAVLVAPMVLDAVANGTPYAYSPEAGTGTATFTFDVPCPDEYYFHGFVYDGDPGPINLSFQDNGADSYAVAVGGLAGTWHYGCQTGGFLVPSWQWQPVMDNYGCVVNDDKIIAPLVAGTHTIELRNLEAGTNAADDPGTAAAIAVLSVTNDPNYAP